jgi:hypothetical protein
MPICRNCGVVIEQGLERCPLCLALLGRVAEQHEGTSPPPGEARSPIEFSKPLTPLRLWEILSLFAGTSMVVVFVADFVYSMTVTWARYPLVSIILLWAAGSLLILLRRHRLLLLVTETAALAIFFLVLDFLMPTEPWFLSLALPLTVLAGTLIGVISVITGGLRHRVFAVLAVILVSVGLFLVGIETVLSLYLSGAFRLSWSLLVFGCTVPLVGLLFYIQYRLKVTSKEVRKIFHL